MTVPNIVPLREEHLSAAAEALARAFHDDPLQVYVFPDPAERAALSPEHFAPILRYGLLFGEVLTTEGTPLGAAVWLPPGEWEITSERAGEAGLSNLAHTIGEGPAGRFSSAMEAIEPYHREIPPHWYLMVVGVSPEGRGRGIGRALIQPILDRADAAGFSCYLETAQPDNVAFYKHLGFKQVVDVVAPQTTLRLWTFRRDRHGSSPAA